MNTSTLTKTEAVLEAFASVARPIFLQHYLRNSCIAGVHVTMKCLERFGILARPAAARLVVNVPALKIMYLSGVSQEDKERGKKQAASWTQVKTSTADWEGHLVAIVEKEWLIDLSFGDSLHHLSQNVKALEGYEDDLVMMLQAPCEISPVFHL